MASKLGEKLEKHISGARQNTATYNFHGVVTRLYADDNLLALAIQDFLRPFRGSPEEEADIEFYLLGSQDGDTAESFNSEGKAELLYDWQVLRYSSEGQFRYQEVPGAGAVIADLDAGLAAAFVEQDMTACAWSMAHVIFFPLWAQMLKMRGLFPVHAAGLVRDGCGIIFPGKSNCGKSTMALKLLRRGFKLLGDDTVFIRARDNGAEMLFFPEEVDVCSETVDLYSQLALARTLTEDRWQPRERVNLREVGAESVVETAKVDLLVFPVIAEDGVTRFEPVPPSAALAELILYAFLFMDPRTTRENFNVLASLVQSVRCYRLFMGLDGDALATTVDEIIAAS
ncbi:MAG: hypothetical protein ACYCXJ_10030 [Thermoleophilia bacterium]